MGGDGGFDRVNGIREGGFNTHFECILYLKLTGSTGGLDKDNFKKRNQG